jgi:hypothetical protein
MKVATEAYLMKVVQKRTWWRLYRNVPDEGCYRSVPDEGCTETYPMKVVQKRTWWRLLQKRTWWRCYRNLPDESCYRNVPDESCYRNVHDRGCTETYLMKVVQKRTWWRLLQKRTWWKLLQKRTWRKLLQKIPDEGCYRNVHDGGCYRNVPDEGCTETYLMKVVQKRSWWRLYRNVPDEGCYRNASSWTLNLITTFLLLSLCRWTISPRGYLPPNKRIQIPLSVVFLVYVSIKQDCFQDLYVFISEFGPTYCDFLHRAQLLMQKLLKYIAPTLQSSLQKSYGRHRELVSQMTRDSFPFMYTN